MKNRFLFSVSFLALAAGMIILNGCKDTATDPTYSALAEIRFANYHQIDPIQIYMYPENASSSDSLTRTAKALTYGIVTGYINDLPTNRAAGEKYHLVAKKAGSIIVYASEDVILYPGDKKTWVISGNGSVQSGTFDTTIINDLPPANQPASLAYFRFLNVTPANNDLDLIVGDPLSGTKVAQDVHYRQASDYVGVPYAKDTTLTFFVVDHNSGIVLSRLAGVGIVPGTYHTMTWGGEAAGYRIPDPTTGQLTLNDTVRIRILDDDVGNDLTNTAPLTFRFNIINALIPPQYPNTKILDYTTGNNNGTKGLSIVINNNTVYDYQGLFPFSLAPGSIKDEIFTNGTDSGTVHTVVPTTANLVEEMYFQFVKPAFVNPSSSDNILFRFFANRSIIVSDELYAVVVFDTVKAPTSLVNAGYDSSAGTYTVPIPDIPIKGSARIVLGYFLAGPDRSLKTTANNNDTLLVDTGNGLVRDKNNYSTGRLQANLGSSTKTFDSSLVVPADGRTITLKSQLAPNPDVTFSFVPESGGIYEAFEVGRRGRSDGMFAPRFIVVRVNP